MARTKPYFRVHLSIASHRNTAGIWSNIIDRSIYCELGRLAIIKYAPKTGDQFFLSSSDLLGITCCDNLGSATVRWKAFLTHCEAGAEALGGHSPVTANPLGRHWQVTFRNLAKKHGMSENKDKDGPPKKKKKKKREEEEEETTTSAPPSEDAVACAERLRKMILHIQPGRSVPTGLTLWARTYDKCLRKPGRTSESIQAQMLWLASSANQDASARFEIFAAEKHHKRYDDIERMMLRCKSDPDAAIKAKADRRREAELKRQAEEQALRDADRLEAERNPVKQHSLLDISSYIPSFKYGVEN